MTIIRTTIAGALAINVPSLYWATVLPTVALVTSAVTLAGIGALLGAGPVRARGAAGSLRIGV